MDLWTILLAAFAVLCIYYFFWKSHRYWDDKGIPNLKPAYIIGDMLRLLLSKEPFALYHSNLYSKSSSQKFVGFYTFRRPSLLIRDPELIRLILTKDFHHFQDRGIKVLKDVDHLEQHLFSMEGEEWKNLRIKMTSTFTSGKMKLMFPLVQECAKQLDDILQGYSADSTDIEAKELCSRLTMDVIGTCAFGLNTNSLKDPNTVFRKMGMQVFKMRYQAIIRLFIPNIPPKIIRMFNFKFLDDATENFFLNLVKDTVKYREENDVIRNDFLDLLISLKNNTELSKCKDLADEAEIQKLISHFGDRCIKSNVEMTDQLLASQCFLFFFAGFETTSSALSFLLMELAMNQDIQDKLRAEIQDVIENNDNEISYRILQKVPYMDMVVSEILRKYPPASTLLRVCTQNYKMPGTDFIVPEGMPVFVPVFGLHNDPLYYSEPEKFKPEHFSEEENRKRPHFAYLPFGDGPRVCIAERFAKMVIKIAIIYLLKEYEFHTSPKMKFPFRFASTLGALSAEGGVWVKCKKIEK